MTIHIQISTCDSGGYRAACPLLPGCTTRAQTREEARRKIGEAIVGYLASVNNSVTDDIASRMVEV